MKWEDWINNPEHYCNRVVDPGTCCPVAHGGYKDYCTCKVSPEMVEAVHKFTHELYLETWRRVVDGKWQLMNHRVDNRYENEPNWTRIGCRKRSGSYTRKDNSVICEMCKEPLDCL